MNEDNFGKITGYLFLITLLSSILISASLFTYAVYNDYILYETYDIMQGFYDDDKIDLETMNKIDEISEKPQTMLTSLDLLWLGFFISFVGSLLVSAYYVKRLGYFEYLTIATFGMMLWLFLSSLFYEIANFLNVNIIQNLLSALSDYVPFYFFYMDNYGLINAIILAFCLILNYLPLDFFKHESRKDADNMGDMPS